MYMRASFQRQGSTSEVGPSELGAGEVDVGERAWSVDTRTEAVTGEPDDPVEAAAAAAAAMTVAAAAAAGSSRLAG